MLKKILGFFLFASFLFQLSCSDQSSSKKVEEPAPKEAQLSKEEEDKLNEYKAEVELGRNMAGRLLQYYGTVGNESLISYVNQIGNYVASYSDFPDRRYMFAILDNESVNAFACPGGYILVTLGTLRLIQNEAELGMILGHEVAHVGKKHMFNTLKTMGEKEVKEAAEKVSKVDDTSVAARVRKRPVNEDSAAGALVARYLSGASGAGFSLLQAAKAGMSVILDKGLSPELEFEADVEGARYAIRAGYFPKAMLNFLSRLQDKKKNIDMKVLGKTHPKTEDRKSKIESLLKELKADAIVGAIGSERFASQAKIIKSIELKPTKPKDKK